MLKTIILLMGILIVLTAEENNNSTEIDLVILPISPPIQEEGANSRLSNFTEDIDSFMIYISKDSNSQWIKTIDAASDENSSEDDLAYSLQRLIKELDWSEVLVIEESYLSKKRKGTGVDIDVNIIICESDGGTIDPSSRYNGSPEELIQSLSTAQNDKWGMYDDPGNRWEQAGPCYLWNHSGEYYEWKKYKLIHDTVKKYVTTKVPLPYKVKFRPFVHRHSVGFRLIKILH